LDLVLASTGDYWSRRRALLVNKKGRTSRGERATRWSGSRRGGEGSCSLNYHAIRERRRTQIQRVKRIMMDRSLHPTGLKGCRGVSGRLEGGEFSKRSVQLAKTFKRGIKDVKIGVREIEKAMIKPEKKKNVTDPPVGGIPILELLP